MAEIRGLTGLRPSDGFVNIIATPPYDVIKPGSRLEDSLKSNPDSLFHIILGPHPAQTLREFKERGILREDREPCFYIYEQTWKGGYRIGVLSAVNVDDYSNRNIIRHEKTFDEKVKGRILLARSTGYNFEPVFLLTKSPISSILKSAIKDLTPLYSFTTSLVNFPDLDGIDNRIFRVMESCSAGKNLKNSVSQNPLYIADGHHRYHAALKNKQSTTQGYIVQDAGILAYNRVINGSIPFKNIMDKLRFEPCEKFQTPPKHSFCIYHKSGAYLLKADNVPDDVCGRLDTCLLEKILYPHLGISRKIISDQDNFDYFPETQNDLLVQAVDSGKYDIAVALHPVSTRELMDVADAGIENSEIVMPEKSTFFSPKILSGIFLQHIS